MLSCRRWVRVLVLAHERLYRAEVHLFRPHQGQGSVRSARSSHTILMVKRACADDLVWVPLSDCQVVILPSVHFFHRSSNFSSRFSRP